ncbi:hypothetical protein BSL78_08520 [Apostichopus japonicus]|uniref:Uncharacterized protein n=1 Tax=Stichopus japonicus TaxID=307972 RepID=A0A2G8L2U8_STIJA|nr:hypothetical protein BSL78_08520 [Apostichopus japonicus]
MSGSRSTGVVVPGVVRTQRRLREPGSGETPGPARPRVGETRRECRTEVSLQTETAPGAGNQSYNRLLGPRDWLRRAGLERTGAQWQKPGPQISKQDPKLVPKSEPTRLTTARPQNGVAGAEARPADPLNRAAAGPEAGNRRDYQCWAAPNPKREPAPSQVPTAKGEILIPRHRTQTSVPRSDRNPRPARPRHHDQSQTKEWNLICSPARTTWFAERRQPVRPRRRGRPLDFGVTEDGYSRFPE